MNCCNPMTGACEQDHGCPVRETHVGLHTGRNCTAYREPEDDPLPIVMYDEPIRLKDLACDCVWWIGTAALVVLLFAAIYLIGRTI